MIWTQPVSSAPKECTLPHLGPWAQGTPTAVGLSWQGGSVVTPPVGFTLTC